MGVTPKRLRTVAPYGGIAAAWFVFQTLISEPTPAGVIVLGVVFGCLNAMLAIGLVLVYRANRIVNFAHGELGGVAVVLVIDIALIRELAHELVAMDQGAVVASGSPVDVLSDPRVVESYLGTETAASQRSGPTS